MPIAWAAAIGAAGSIASSAIQSGGQQQAAGIQQAMFNTVVGQEQPFLQGGYGAENTLNQLMGYGSTGAGSSTGGTPGYDPSSGSSIGPGGGISQLIPGGTAAGASGTAPTSNVNGTGLPTGYLTQTFNPTEAQLEAYPGYQFQLSQGDLAVNSASSAGSSALSGPALKSLMSFNQGLASSNYQNYFNQFQTQQNNIFNRLSNIAAMGQNAAGNLGTAGANLGTGIAQAQAAAAGSIAGGISGASNNIGQSILMSNMMNPNSGWTPSGSSVGAAGADSGYQALLGGTDLSMAGGS
jgi:hypothetical protein